MMSILIDLDCFGLCYSYLLTFILMLSGLSDRPKCYIICALYQHNAISNKGLQQVASCDTFPPQAGNPKQ